MCCLSCISPRATEDILLHSIAQAGSPSVAFLFPSLEVLAVVTRHHPNESHSVHGHPPLNTHQQGLAREDVAASARDSLVLPPFEVRLSGG